MKNSVAIAEIIFLVLKRENLPLSKVIMRDKIIRMIFDSKDKYFIINSIFFEHLPYEDFTKR